MNIKEMQKILGALDDSKHHTTEELEDLAGIFYKTGDEQWCDLPRSTFKFIPERDVWVKLD